MRISDRASPALTTRLRAELKYILQANYWKPALKLLAKLNALSCLHQDLVLTKTLAWQVACVSRWLFYIDVPSVQPWLIRLEVLIAYLASAQRLEVAQNLQLPKDSLQRLEQLEIWETEIAPQLLNSNSPSQIYQLLQSYKPLTLILFAARSRKNIRHVVWQYITKLSQVKPLLTGNDLKTLGYKPGKLYKQILDDVLAATLDGKIGDRATDKKYVQENYML
ncbi:MAG: hypothetical protein ACFCAD_23160 [Pleurocapsa sp.]